MIWEIVGSIFFSVLATEIYDSCPRLTNLLLRAASRRLPAECRDRYWEEWIGELDAQGDLGKLRKLLWALWVFLCSWQVGRTLQEAIEQAKALTAKRQEMLKREREVISFKISMGEPYDPSKLDGLKEWPPKVLCFSNSNPPVIVSNHPRLLVWPDWKSRGHMDGVPPKVS